MAASTIGAPVGGCPYEIRALLSENDSTNEVWKWKSLESKLMGAVVDIAESRTVFRTYEGLLFAPVITKAPLNILVTDLCPQVKGRYCRQLAHYGSFHESRARGGRCPFVPIRTNQSFRRSCSVATATFLAPQKRQQVLSRVSVFS